ncbi:hypothetical protein BDR22DRAFT_166911 [Usnea florida]
MAFGRDGLMLHVPAAVFYLGGSCSLQIRYSPVQQTAQITALYTNILWCRYISSLFGLIASTLLVDLFFTRSHHQVQAATFVSGLRCSGYGLDLTKVRLGSQRLLAMPQRQRNARNCHGA